MYIKTEGLVLRETKYKESSRMLTVLSAKNGKIPVKVQGTNGKDGGLAASAQLLTLSDMTLLQRIDGRYTLTEAHTVEEFRGLRDDIKKLALGSYFAELLESVANEDAPTPALLQHGLNGLYALSVGLRNDALIKAAFELRLMCIAGFAPQVDECFVCKTAEPRNPFLPLREGRLCCGSCLTSEMSGAFRLSQGCLAAVRYITHADAKRLYSFKLDEPTQMQLTRLCELYTYEHLGRRFATLEYYHDILQSEQ